jgi:hypothetical protein
MTEMIRSDGELRWRDPPGWAVLVEKIGALAFEGAISAGPAAIKERFALLTEIVTSELPESDERSRILVKLRGLAGLLLGISGADL